jgi:tryptophan synthase beta chain
MGLFDAFIDDDGVRLVGVEAGGRGIRPGDHAARFAGGAAGVLHGTRSLVLQDEAGNILPTHSVSAGLDYASIGPEHAWLGSTGRTEYAWIDDDAALQGFAWLAEREGILPGARVVARARVDAACAADTAGRNRGDREPLGARRQGRRDRSIGDGESRAPLTEAAREPARRTVRQGPGARRQVRRLRHGRVIRRSESPPTSCARWIVPAPT